MSDSTTPLNRNAYESLHWNVAYFSAVQPHEVVVEDVDAPASHVFVFIKLPLVFFCCSASKNSFLYILEFVRTHLFSRDQEVGFDVAWGASGTSLF